MSFFSGVQQIGIGVRDAVSAYNWYKSNLGFGLKLFDDEAEASLMKNYTGGEAHSRRAILALKPEGGGGLEIWQFKSRKPSPTRAIRPGDCGILAAVVGELPKEKINKDVLWEGSLGTTDPDGNIFIPAMATPEAKKGIRGAVIGVRDLQKAEAFYCDILGFTKVREQDVVWNGVEGKTVVLQLSSKKALFSNLLGPMELQLVTCSGVAQEHLFTNRYWGDMGFIHLCFEVPNMDVFKKKTEAAGCKFHVDSGSSFGMSDAAGRFAYIEDPDGTLIELVETHKIPIIKKLGISIDLKSYKEKPIEQWKLNFLRWFN